MHLNREVFPAAGRSKQLLRVPDHQFHLTPSPVKLMVQICLYDEFANSVHRIVEYIMVCSILPRSAEELVLELSSTRGGEEAARVPRMASSSSNQGHVILPWPEVLLESFTYCEK